MGQRNPIRDQPPADEVEVYILDMLWMMARLAADAELFDLSKRVREIVEPGHLAAGGRGSRGAFGDHVRADRL